LQKLFSRLKRFLAHDDEHSGQARIDEHQNSSHDFDDKARIFSGIFLLGFVLFSMFGGMCVSTSPVT